MKLLILSELFPSTWSPASGWFVANQVVELARRMDVTVLVPVVQPLSPRRWRSWKGRPPLVLPPDVALPPERVHYIRYQGLPWLLDSLNVYSAYLAVYRAIRHLNLAPDIIHCHPSYPTGYVGHLVARRLGVPLGVTTHGFDIDVFAHSKDFDKYSGDPAFPFRFYSRRTHRRVVSTLSNCARVVAVSRAMKQKVDALGLRPDQVIVIPNGVEPSMFYPMDGRTAREKVGLPEEAKVVLYLATLNHRKGPLHLIEAIKRLRDEGRQIKLVLRGDGDMKDEARRLIAHYSLEKDVLFPPPIASEDVPVWINACDVLALPSYYESFGVVLLEALACGRPVVTTPTGGVPEFVLDGKHGALVPPGNPASLAQAIAQVLDKHWDRDALARYAHTLSWERVATELEHLYTDIVAERQRAALSHCLPQQKEGS